MPYSLWFADRAGKQRSWRVAGDKSCFSALRADTSQLCCLQIAEVCRLGVWGEGWEGWMLVLASSSYSGRGENDFTMWRGCGSSRYVCSPAKLSFLSRLNRTSEVMLGRKYRIAYFRVYSCFRPGHMSMFSCLCTLSRATKGTHVLTGNVREMEKNANTVGCLKTRVFLGVYICMFCGEQCERGRVLGNRKCERQNKELKRLCTRWVFLRAAGSIFPLI